MIKLLDRLFQTLTWKILSILAITIMLLVFTRMALVLGQSAEFSSSTAKRTGINSSFLDQTVSQGKVAAAALLLILIAGFCDLINSVNRLNEYRGITKVMSKFQAGDYFLRAPKFNNSEARKLGDAFNSMAEAIVANVAKLKETDELRRELVANFAHDLGGPLTSIRGFVETLLSKEKDFTQEQTLKILQIILNNTESISTMVSGLMQLSILDAYAENPTLVPFSISTLANDVASRLAPKAKEKNIQLQVEDTSNLPLVLGDVSLIERVLSNLIENAVKYTPAGGSVKVSFQKVKEEVCIIITDTGIGIPKESLQKVYDRFYRVSKDRSRKTGGSGLGLSIVKRILELHGSSVTIDSKEGVGTSIKFTINTAGKSQNQL